MKAVLRALTVCLGLTAAGGTVAIAQEADTTQAPREALRVFMDCRSRFCDFDYFRREILFVNYVRDREVAEVHILITTRGTGGGGEEFTIEFIGQEEFETLGDTLYYFSSDTDTEDEVRTGLTQMIRLGLIRYAARTEEAERIQIEYELPAGMAEAEMQVPDDPWNYWIFRIRVGGSFRGEQRQESFSANTTISANRTTLDWKISTGFSGFYADDRFEFSDGSSTRSFAREYGSWFFIARSLGQHWSAGAVTEVRVSTFRNQDFAWESGPAVEWNFFPYDESTRRELTLTYFVGMRYWDYEQITIFDQLEEWRPSQSLEASYTVKQPFGTINLSVEGSHFIDDPSLHRVDVRGWLNIRLVRGLQLNLNGSFSRIKDQIFLAREGATDEEVLLRRRELGTDFRYRFGVSISYTFGSIFNNVVNPRFD